MAISDSLIRHGKRMMDNANQFKDNPGIQVCERITQTGRGFSTTDAMGGSGLILYGLGRLLSWVGL